MIRNVIRDSNVRSCYTKFRISAHRLEIECGRYKNIPISERLCKMCNLGKTEDEIHFMLECPKYDTIRSIYLQQCADLCKNFATLNCKDQFIFLLSNENEKLIETTASYIWQCFNLRLQHLNNVN